MAGEADDADIEGEVFSAKLGADADLAGDSEEFFFQLEIAEGLAVFVALGGEVVVIFGGGEFDGFQAGLGGSAADDESEVVGRAGGGAEGTHFFDAEFSEALGVEEGFRFLIEEGLVGGAASLVDEEEIVFVSGGGVELDLGGEVILGVDLLIHGKGGDLRVAEVFLGVGFVDSFGEVGFVVGSGPDVLTFFPHDDGGAGVLTAGEDAVSGNLSILEKHEGDHAVVLGGLGVIEDGGDLLEVGGAELEGNGLGGFVGE